MSPKEFTDASANSNPALVSNSFSYKAVENSSITQGFGSSFSLLTIAFLAFVDLSKATNFDTS